MFDKSLIVHRGEIARRLLAHAPIPDAQSGIFCMRCV